MYIEGVEQFGHLVEIAAESMRFRQVTGLGRAESVEGDREGTFRRVQGQRRIDRACRGSRFSPAGIGCGRA
jgi:hypothetical protein